MPDRYKDWMAIQCANLVGEHGAGFAQRNGNQAIGELGVEL
ncbi:MAG: hypothetical protein ACR2OY_03815 [Boseongicola sp.]